VGLKYAGETSIHSTNEYHLLMISLVVEFFFFFLSKFNSTETKIIILVHYLGTIWTKNPKAHQTCSLVSQYNVRCLWIFLAGGEEELV